MNACNRQPLFFLLFSLLVMLVLSCASTGTPTGGPRDTRPPVLDTIRSSRNKQVNVRPELLVFYFDEFVEVKDAIKQVLVSPPLTYIPKVVHRGKRVTFQFDEKEVLKDNATYTINFGDAIVDYHEGNVLSPFSYVFGTGSFLDSLNLEGNVMDARTGEAEKEMIVLLYDNLEDSIVRKEKPLYFTRLNKDGQFLFQNIKSDTFRLLAIKDENLNYRYDLETEKIAFSDSLVILGRASEPSKTLFASLPDPRLKVLAWNAKSYGKVNFLYNARPPDTLDVRISDPNIPFAVEKVQDSLNVYYDTAADSFHLFVGLDTFKVKPKGKADFLKKSRFALKYTSQVSNFPARDSVEIGFSQPLGRFDQSEVSVTDSIGLLEGVKIRLSEDKKAVIVSYPWQPGGRYRLKMPAQRIQSMYGMWNDSISLDLSILPVEKTSGLKIIIEDLDSTAQYIVRVLREQMRLSQQSVNGVTSYSLSYSGLTPDKYNVEIIRDTNGNGRWDPANYWKKSQAEPYFLFKGDKLRENWDSEMKVSLSARKESGVEPKAGQAGLPFSNPLQQKKK
jgi:hypothetical protein